MISTDIVIIGGGCVGLTAAIGLADKGFKVAVLDKAGAEVPLEQPELRVSAISAASENIFRGLNVWSQINDQRLAPYTSMKVWDKDSFGNIEFHSEQVGEHRLGHIIENNNIRNGLIEVAKQHNNISLMWHTAVSKLHNDDEQVFLTLEDGSPLVAKLLLAADGALSWVRKQVQTPMSFSDYDHHAIVATVSTTEPHSQCARQVFLPDGPLALLPLWKSDQCSIVWSTEPERAKSLMAMSAEEFSKALTAASDSMLGVVNLESERAVFPLTMRYAQKWLTKRVVLMGDAAHTIHPLAGLGMNLGLLDAASLVQCLSAVDDLETDTVYPLLRQYERWRKAEAQQYIAAMGTLKSLFSGNDPVKKIIRGVGLSFTNHAPLIKDKIIEQAMGLAGELPELAKFKDPI